MTCVLAHNSLSRVRKTMKSSAALTYFCLAISTIVPGALGQSVVDIVVNDEELEVLEMAVRAAGLVDALIELDPVTVFGPVN